MVCSEHRKLQLIRILVILTAILTLVQGIGYLGLSIWSILVHKCLQISIKNPLEKVIYFIYFRDSECGEVNWSNNGNNQQNVIPDMPNVTKIASRTFYIFISYAIISALWIITSLMVLGAFCSIVNRRAFRVCFLPWLIFILSGSVLDVIGTVFFVNDIFYTETAEKALDYLSVKNTSEMMKVLKGYDEYFSYPAVRLALISSRCILVWIYNVVAVIFCVKLTKFIIRTNEINNHKPQILISETFNDDGPRASHENNNNNNHNNQNQHRNERRSFEPLKSGEPIPKTTQSGISSPEPKPNIAETSQIERHESLLSNRKIDNVHDYTDINDSPVHPVKLRHNQQYNQPHHHQFTEPTTSVPQQQRDSYRNPYQESSIPDSLLCKPERRSVNAELRSQLPWSYFGPRNETTAPKHTLSHLSSPNEQNNHLDNDHEVLPPIPVPDYTLHFPKDDRPSVVKSYNNSQSQHQKNLNRERSPSPRNSVQQSRW